MAMHSRIGTLAPQVLAALAAAILTAGGLAGCRSAYKPPPWQSAQPTLSIKNDSMTPARVAMAEGRRDAARPGGVLESAVSKPVTLRPGAMQVWSIESKIPPAERIIRFKVETISASWEEPVVAWFEVVGPMPKKTISLERPQNGAFAVRTFDGDVRVVPREYWIDAGSQPADAGATPGPSQKPAPSGS